MLISLLIRKMDIWWKRVGHQTMEPFGCGFSSKNIHAWKAIKQYPFISTTPSRTQRGRMCSLYSLVNANQKKRKELMPMILPQQTIISCIQSTLLRHLYHYTLFFYPKEFIHSKVSTLSLSCF